MMAAPKSRPGLSGLFRSRNKSDLSVTLTSMSTYDYGSKSPSPSKISSDNKIGPFAKGFTHFSNYKPKILAGSGAHTNAASSDDTTPDVSSIMENNQSGSHSGPIAAGVTKASIHPEPAVPSTSSAGRDILLRNNKSELGNYTPRYRSRKTSSEQKFSAEKQIPATHNSNSVGHKVSVKKGKNTKSSSNVIIMGDKDTPISLESPGLDSSIDGDDLPDELPQDSFSEEMEDTSSALDNILVFGTEAPARSSSSVDSYRDKPTMADTPVVNGSVSETKDGGMSSLVNGGKDPALPYIPPPDYDEDEMMLEISDEDDQSTIPNPKHHQMRGTKVYKVFQGEDFGKYLVEDESAFESPLGRTQLRHNNRNTPRSAKGSKTEKKRNKDKTKGAKGKGEETLKRRTIHDITFNSTKLGVGDSGNKSSTAWQSRNGPGSPTSKSRYSDYELFLRDRKGSQLKNGSLESTSDSGNESGEGSSKDSYPAKRDESKTLPNRLAKKNSSVWEKLTWRFRRRSRGEIIAGESR